MRAAIIVVLGRPGRWAQIADEMGHRTMAEARVIDGHRPGLHVHVFRQMRADILAGHLMPNARLRMEALRERYQAGSTPIREALMRLDSEGFVQLEHNRGFRVAGVSQQHLLDLTRTRIEVESIALRWSVERADVDWEAELLAAFHRLSRQSKIDPSNRETINPSWIREHRIFHLALVQACGSPLLLEIRERLFDQAERYVTLSIASKQAPRDDVAEHQAIMNAALSRDIELTVELSRNHIEKTTEKVTNATELFETAVRQVPAIGGRPHESDPIAATALHPRMNRL